MKKLILVNSSASGGAERVASILSRHLDKTVSFAFIYTRSFFEFSPERLIHQLTQLEGKERKIFTLVQLISSIFRLKSIVHEEDYKVVQSHMYLSNYINILSKLIGSKHKVQVVNCDCITTKFERGLTASLNKLLVKWLYPKADLIISKSEAMNNDMINFLNKSNLNTTVIYNPVDCEYILNKKIEKTEFNRDYYPFDKLLVNVSRFHSQKRQRDIILALSSLSSEFGVVFIGEGKHLEDCKLLAKKLNVFDRTIFLGKKSNPFNIIAQCDAFVMSSSCEGFPNALVEAMCCGLPIISADCLSGPREILTVTNNPNDILQKEATYLVGDYGLLYPVGNIAQLCNSIKYLFSNDRVLDFSKRAVNASRKFNLPIIISRYNKVLNCE